MIARAFRHLVVAPVFLVLVLVSVLLSPLLLLLAAAVSPLVDRRWRPLRALMFTLVYAVHDALAVIGGFGLWCRLAGRGAMSGEAMQQRHYSLIAWLLRRLSEAAVRILALRVVVDGSPEAEAAIRGLTLPLIVLSRHAGPGDSFLLVHELLQRGRRPRIVLRSALQLDPCIDLLGHRLPFCFVQRGGQGESTCRRISEIAAGMDSRGALLLFPEGGNVTPERRRRALRRLLREGRWRRLQRAAALRHVVAPRVGGTLAALEGAPGASVVFIAHSGLAGMSSSLWRRVPVDRELLVHMWLVGPEEIPTGEQARTDWLLTWWGRLDEWIGRGTSAESLTAGVAG